MLILDIWYYESTLPSESGSPQKVVESVIGYLEQKLSEGKFSEVDLILKEADVTRLTPAALIAALSITFWGKGKLLERDDFLARVEPEVKKRLGEERGEKLLTRRR